MSPAGEGDLARALYLHVPFCVRRCRYCDFATCAVSCDDPLVGAYEAALSRTAERLASAGLLSGVRTAYVGGGTPSIATAPLAGLVGAVGRLCPRLGELTCEANPDSLSPEASRILASSGVGRVSLGVQSLADPELRRLGRVHDASRARVAARGVVDAGMRLSCDLMCAIPLQTPESLAFSIDGVLECGAGHVSVYPLTVEDGTPLARACEAGEEAYPDDDIEADLMELAARTLQSHGLARYEVASYALPGQRCAHNESYWTGVPYLGVGTSAASMLTPGGYGMLRETLPLLEVRAEDETLSHDETDVARVRLTMVDPPRDFVRAVDSGERLRVEVETLTTREAVAEDMMLSLRMTEGMPPELVGRGRSCGMGAALDRAIERATGDGLAERAADGSIVPTRRGWLLGNELYGLFWGLAHD